LGVDGGGGGVVGNGFSLRREEREGGERERGKGVERERGGEGEGGRRERGIRREGEREEIMGEGGG
jgi:hypothetical protein